MLIWEREDFLNPGLSNQDINYSACLPINGLSGKDITIC